MKLSVLINNYNNAPFLEECIESVLQQERPADEIIIVDDGSTDNSREILEKYQKCPSMKIIYQENQGQTTAIATGIDHAVGDILFLLDGDDLYRPHHLAALEKRWLQYPDADLIYCRCDYADATRSHVVINSLIGEVQNPEEPYEWGYTNFLAHFMYWYFLGNYTSCISMRRKHAITLRLHDIVQASPIPLFAHADYIILLASALSFGRKVYVPDTTVGYRIREESDSSQRHLLSKYKNYMSGMVPAKIACLKVLGIAWNSLDPSLVDAEIEDIPNPTQGHLNCYKDAKAFFLKENHLYHFLLEETTRLRWELKMLQQSCSWKVTKPLRVVRSLLGKVLSK